MHYETFFIGKSLKGIYNNRKGWAKEAAYYLNKEPESIFVLENTETKNVVGYVFGYLDDKNHDELKHVLKSFFVNLFTIPFTKESNKTFLKGRVWFIFGAILGKSEELKLKISKECRSSSY